MQKTNTDTGTGKRAYEGRHWKKQFSEHANCFGLVLQFLTPRNSYEVLLRVLRLCLPSKPAFKSMPSGAITPRFGVPLGTADC